MTTEFGKSLLDAARVRDVPAAGAKGRALDFVARAATTAATTAAASSAVAGAAKAKIAWALVAAAAFGGAAVGFGVSRATDPPAPIVVSRARDDGTSAPSVGVSRVGPPSAPPPLASRDDAEVSPPRNACAALPDAPPARCSQTGRPVPISVRNGCAADADVFWVDGKCREIFHARLAPGESFERVTQDAHVWRVRDHATHALLKEFVPQRVPGAPELVRNAPRRALPDVVVRAGESAKDGPPAACSSAGMPTKFALKNERDAQIVVMWIGLDCKEKYWQFVDPKGSIVVEGVDADAWRIRDATTGEVVTDIPPDVPDTTTYVTVP